MCTNLQLTAQDGSVVVGRSMEFAADLGWRLLISPRGSDYVGTAPDGPGHTWTATHGFVGVSALGRPVVTDGVNEAGLFAGVLYLPGLAEYEDASGIDAASLVSADEITSLVLGLAATVDEAVAVVEGIVVWNRIEELLGDILPLHLVVHDRTGAMVVIEWIGGVRRVHRSPVKVCTNNPSYDWHETNLRNYVNLSVNNSGPREIDGETFTPLAQGSGLLGLPGDWTSPSRFVRATALTAGVLPPADAATAMTTALHMMNTFDIPLGMIRDTTLDANESTQWVSVANLADPTYLVRTYVDPTPRQVRLADVDLNTGHPIRTVALPAEPTPEAFAV